MKLYRGSLLAEALIELFLLSFILSLYAPAYCQLIENQQSLFNQTNQWQIFYYLCLASQNRQDTFSIINKYNAEHSISIENFQFNHDEAFIRFSDGSEQYIAITDFY